MTTVTNTVTINYMYLKTTVAAFVTTNRVCLKPNSYYFRHDNDNTLDYCYFEQYLLKFKKTSLLFVTHNVIKTGCPDTFNNCVTTWSDTS